MDKSIKSFLSRYFSIIGILILSPILYYLLLQITLIPIFFALRPFFSVILSGNSIISGDYTIEIVRACVGTSAVILLLALNLATPKITAKTRANLAISSVVLFLTFNWARIFTLSLLYLNESILFNEIHAITWYAGSTIAVALIWIVCTRKLKIRGIPFFSDAVYLSKKIKSRN